MLVISRAADRAVGAPGKSFHARSVQKYSRRGQLNNGVRRTSKCLSMLTVKALLIILPKRSLIEFRQCNGNRKKRKQHEDAAQKGKNHESKASWGPLKIWEPRGTIPCSPTPPHPPPLPTLSLLGRPGYQMYIDECMNVRLGWRNTYCDVFLTNQCLKL